MRYRHGREIRSNKKADAKKAKLAEETAIKDANRQAIEDKKAAAQAVIDQRAEEFARCEKGCVCGRVPCPMAKMKKCPHCGEIKQRMCGKKECKEKEGPLLLTMRPLQLELQES